MSVKSTPTIAALIVPWFVADVRGKTLMYDDITTYGGEWFKGTVLEGYGHWFYCAFSMVAFLAGTDFCIYWIHRWLHIPAIYKRLHKPHHKWVVPTPFASLAFHPLDGYSQSIPYHVIPFVLPLNKWIFLGLFVIVNLWTIVVSVPYSNDFCRLLSVADARFTFFVQIHDGDMISGHILERYINSPAHHTLHHLYFTCNYGQYFTWADSMGGSYRAPRPDLDPIHDAIKNMERKRKLAEKEEREAMGTLKSSQEVSMTISGEESDSGYEGSEAEVEVVKSEVTKSDDKLRKRR